MTTKVNEARDLVRKLKKEHRELSPRIREAETSVATATDEEAKKAAQAEYDTLKAEAEALEAKRVDARKSLENARLELRKEFNRSISKANMRALGVLRMLARRESFSESRIRAKERVLERRGA